MNGPMGSDTIFSPCFLRPTVPCFFCLLITNHRIIENIHASIDIPCFIWQHPREITLFVHPNIAILVTNSEVKWPLSMSHMAMPKLHLKPERSESTYSSVLVEKILTSVGPFKSFLNLFLWKRVIITVICVDFLKQHIRGDL